MTLKTKSYMEKKTPVMLFILRVTADSMGKNCTDGPLKHGLMFQENVFGVRLSAEPLVAWGWGFLTPRAEPTGSHQSRDAPCGGEQRCPRVPSLSANTVPRSTVGKKNQICCIPGSCHHSSRIGDVLKTGLFQV